MSKHWQSFGEYNNSEAFQKSQQDEFKEELPFELDGAVLEAQTPRRDFLKYLGFSTAAAAIAASCEVPVKKSIPFANRPEEIVPGIPNYYATTYINQGDALSIIAKVRDGRPIKIEGNDLSPITGGGTSAKVQASVLDLYDGARLRFPTINGKEATFDAIDKDLVNILGGNTVLLSSTINSPSSLEIISQLKLKNPNFKHIQYDAISYSGILNANKVCYGKQIIPTYKFDVAKAIVSIGADFLGTWISPVEYAKAYAKGKKLNPKNLEMSRHIAFETVASLTGSNADERFLHRPSETGVVVLGLLNAINGLPINNISDKKLIIGIEKAAKALKAASGDALVICGSNDTNIQIVINAINEAIGANGKTIDYNVANNTRAGIDGDFATLLDTKIDALIVLDANPIYTWGDSNKVENWIKVIPVTVSLNSRKDETSSLCKYQIPAHHYLESWGDVEIQTGHYSFLQPTINPLFKTRQWQDTLLKWSGSTSSYLDILKEFWGTKLAGTTWDKTLQQGLYSLPSIASINVAYNAAQLEAAKLALEAMPISKEVELVAYQKVAIGAGEGTMNPWLMEMPDPVTRATWDNYLVISPSKAKSLLGIDLTNNGQADAYEVQPKKKVVEIVVGNKKINLPVLIIPGTHPETVGIALGYGRNSKIGKAANNNEEKPVGENAYQFTSFTNGNVSYFANNVKLTKTNDLYPVALTQTHNIYNTDQGNRTEVMKELTLAELKHNPKEVLEERAKELAPWGGVENFREEGSIYKPIDKPGVKWGLSIDLNACNGCGACVIACHTENNVSVVGKSEVLRFHDMHWMRIDRYYSGSDLDNPSVVFQPMMCQHCDNAPCENVCPVAATNHSSEGLNQMTYNRCIGTRYCANNCPYKVRRFNWADYTGSDSFKNNQDEMNDAVMYMNEDLTRMVLNPDVTVRSRGVIEKCSFCVQRLQEGKLKAKKESRPLETGGHDKGWDVKTACQQSCPTEAIVFGNVNDKHSAITMHRSENENRLFYSLEQLHVMPNVSYLAKVRNIETDHKA
jgi:MoCo/4Fe-4S cofactor protein with predicted Tat translocation signal